MEDRRELVEDAVEQTKRLAEQARKVAQSQARVAARDLRDAFAPAAPALARGALAVGLGLVGMTLLVLPFAAKVASHPVACGIIGGAALGVSYVSARRAWEELPSDLMDRIRDVLREDLTTAVDAATEPTHH